MLSFSRPLNCIPFDLYFSLNNTATTEIYTLSLHDALPISICAMPTSRCRRCRPSSTARSRRSRSEEHTSELQSLTNLVCRLLLEKKKEERERPGAYATILSLA